MIRTTLGAVLLAVAVLPSLSVAQATPSISDKERHERRCDQVFVSLATVNAVQSDMAEDALRWRVGTYVPAFQREQASDEWLIFYGVSTNLHSSMVAHATRLDKEIELLMGWLAEDCPSLGPPSQ